MTDEEKAEEYAEKITDIVKARTILPRSELIQRYAGIVQGVLYGLAEGRKEVREHETTCVNRLHHIEKENAELKKALKNHPETASATQLLELIQVREENERLEKEKCELLGIIQAKDEVIAELKAHCKAVDEVNEKMKNKLNCTKYHYCLCKDKVCKDCNDWELEE